MEFLKNRDLKYLSSLLIYNKEDIDFNKLVFNIILLLIFDSLKKIKELDRASLRQLNTFGDKELNFKAFKKLQNTDTVLKYAKTFNEFIIFLFNTILAYENIDLSQGEEEEENTSEVLRGFYTIPEELKSEIKDLFLAFNELINGPNPVKFRQTQKEKQIINEKDLNSDSDNFTNLSEANSTSENSENNTEISSDNLVLNKTKKEIIWPGDSEKIIKKQLLNLVIKLIQLPSAPKWSNPIETFFGIKTINKTTLTLMGPARMSQFYSHFIYIIQLFILEYSYQDSNNKVDLIYIKITKLMKKYCHNDSRTGIAEILTLRPYAQQINKQASGETYKINWINSEKINIGHVTISKNNLISIFGNSILKTWDLLKTDLLLNISPTELNFLTLEQASEYENNTINTPGWYFINNNPKFNKSGSNYLLNYIKSSPELLNQWFNKNPSTNNI